MRWAVGIVPYRGQAKLFTLSVLLVGATGHREHPIRHSRYGIPYDTYSVLWQNGVVG